MRLQPYHKPGVLEAGIDETGRGGIASPGVSADVILPPDAKLPRLNDSKKLTSKTRYALRVSIQEMAVDFAVAWVDNEEIDRLNIFKASMVAMHRAVEKLSHVPGHLLVDGKYFYPYRRLPYQCIVRGDGQYLSIAAASVLAKTYRDDYMIELSADYPQYCWEQNKGYPTPQHRKALSNHGLTPYHRKSFKLLPDARQLAAIM